VPAWRKTGRANLPALIALPIAIAFGVQRHSIFATHGIPRTSLGIGCLVALAARSRSRRRLLGFPQGSEPLPATPELAGDESPKVETTR
jgi:hypothetical protein